MTPASSPAPVVSVIMPTFNRLGFLRAALDSVFEQTLPEWELIIADDGSNAETRAYLQSIAEAPRVRVLSLSHLGNPGAVRNAALRAARGEYVAFLDSDDEWSAAKLERQVSDLRAGGARWGYTAFERIDGTGRSIPEGASRWKYPAGDIFEALLAFDVGIALPSVMVERDLLGQAGGFDERQVLYEDFDLWLRLALLSGVSVVREPLVRVRAHDGHFSSDGLEAEEARDGMLRKLQALPLGPRRGAAVRAARARCGGRLAALRASQGCGASAWRIIVESSRFGWRYGAWWLGIVKSMAHLCLPDPLIALLRRGRRPARLA